MDSFLANYKKNETRVEDVKPKSKKRKIIETKQPTIKLPKLSEDFFIDANKVETGGKKKRKRAPAKFTKNEEIDHSEIIDPLMISHQDAIHIPTYVEFKKIQQSLSNLHKNPKINDKLLLKAESREAEFLVRDKIRKEIEFLLKMELGIEEIEIKLFGSSESKLFLLESDMDLNLYVPGNRIPNCLEKVRKIILKYFNTDKLKVFLKDEARVPVLEIKNLEILQLSSKAFDIDLVHSCGSDEKYTHNLNISKWTERHLNSENAKKYRLFDICLLIKSWSKKNQINSPIAESLPSLGYLVMIFSTFEYILHHCFSSDAYFPFEVPHLKKLADFLKQLSEKQKEKILPAAFLFAFFLRFAFWDDSVSVKTLDSIGSFSIFHLQSVASDPRCQGFGTSAYVQDPFLVDINLARFVTIFSFPTICDKFKNALASFSDVQSLDELFSP